MRAQDTRRQTRPSEAGWTPRLEDFRKKYGEQIAAIVAPYVIRLRLSRTGRPSSQDIKETLRRIIRDLEEGPGRSVELVFAGIDDTTAALLELAAWQRYRTTNLTDLKQGEALEIATAALSGGKPGRPQSDVVARELVLSLQLATGYLTRSEQDELLKRALSVCGLASSESALERLRPPLIDGHPPRGRFSRRS